MSQSQLEGAIELTSDQVLEMTLDTLTEHFQLVVEGYQFSTEDIWNVVIVASAQGQAIESAARQLEEVPAPSTVRLYLRTGLVEVITLQALEEQCNAALVAHLPPHICGGWHQVAIDLTYIPYHGEAAKDPDEIRRGKAKSGTTHFHPCYPLLPDPLPRPGGNQPVVIRGKKGGTRALLQGRRGYTTTYTMHSVEYGEATFRVGVVRKYNKGRYKRCGVHWFAYALLGLVRMPLQQIYEAYRLRFGIESTYRLMNRVRARTSSRSLGLRLLFVGVALTLVNIWVYLKWAYLGWPRRGGRDVREELFPLTMFRQFLLEAIKAIYKAVRSVSLPKPYTVDMR